MKEFYINDDGIRLHAKLEMPADEPVETSKCPLMVLFHGFTGHMEERHLLAATNTALETGVAVLRVELYGHGQSDGKFEDHTFFKWISNGLAVIDYAKSLPFVSELYVCGHSQGGLLTIYMGALRAEDISALIPLAPATVIPDAANKGIMLGKHFDPDHIPAYVEIKGRPLKKDYFAVSQLLHPEDLFCRYHGPVLIVHGDADEAVPVSYAYEAAKQYENCSLVIIPGDTHCYDHHLEMVTEALKDFLRSLQGK